MRKSLTLAMISEDYPPDKWTHVYTDGSAKRAIKDGGAGILIEYALGRQATHHMATGKPRSNYRAETEALMKAVSLIRDSIEDVSSVVFFLRCTISPGSTDKQQISRSCQRQNSE